MGHVTGEGLQILRNMAVAIKNLIFQIFDGNQDGKITNSELKDKLVEILKSADIFENINIPINIELLWKIIEQEIEEGTGYIIVVCDKDGNGGVDKNEFEKC